MGRWLLAGGLACLGWVTDPSPGVGEAGAAPPVATGSGSPPAPPPKKRIAPATPATPVAPSASTPSTSAAPPTPSQGLTITSDTLEMDDRQQTATFSGSVVAVDGEMRLTARRMTVHYSAGEGGVGGQKVEEVVAEGEVVIVEKDSEGRGAQARYWTQKDLMELHSPDGTASIQRGKEHLRGRTIRIHLGADRRITRLEALGGGPKGGPGGGRVTARIQPNGALKGGGGDANADKQKQKK